MSERITGVEPIDPSKVFVALSRYLASTYALLDNGPLFAAATSKHAALKGEFPADASQTKEAELLSARDEVCETLSWLKENGMAVSILDPDSGAWCAITGVGTNKEKLRLVATVRDPAEPSVTVNRWLDPSTQLSCSPLETDNPETHHLPFRLPATHQAQQLGAVILLPGPPTLA